MYGTSYAKTVFSWNNNATSPVEVYLQDPCYGTGVVVWDADNQIECRTGPDGKFAIGLGNWVGDANFQLTGNVRVLKYTTGQVWNSGLGDGTLGSRSAATVAADTYGWMHKTFRFLDYAYHRAGLSGSNLPKVRALVHHPSDPTNWYAKDSTLFVAMETAEHYDMASLDVIAHELAHGLNAQGPKLQLAGEPGKLSESTSNMFAMLVSAHEWTYDPLPYRIGELTLKNNQSMERALTYMDAPALKSGTLTCYIPDIGTYENHRGAGPGDHMFYLLVFGGSSLCNSNVVEGIGIDAATAIWKAAFFSLSFDSGYHDLRQQFITAATNYAGVPSTVLSSTIAAFDAVEIP